MKEKYVEIMELLYRKFPDLVFRPRTDESTCTKYRARIQKQCAFFVSEDPIALRHDILMKYSVHQQDPVEAV